MLLHYISLFLSLSLPLPLTTSFLLFTESALAHVLCSADTVYGDVAGQMFVVQALTDPAQFQLFQHLASQGTYDHFIPSLYLNQFLFLLFPLVLQ